MRLNRQTICKLLRLFFGKGKVLNYNSEDFDEDSYSEARSEIIEDVKNKLVADNAFSEELNDIEWRLDLKLPLSDKQYKLLGRDRLN